MRTLVMDINTPSILLTLVTASLWAFPVQAGEYWISPSNSLGNLQTNTTVSGQGTLENPYYGKFDQVISSIASNSIIHLWPGVYWSTGQVAGVTTNFDQKWKTGQKLRGSGIDTTILRITNEPGSQYQLYMIYTTNASVEVSDLTAEYSGPPSAALIRSGVLLLGSNSKIDRVKATGLFGTYPHTPPAESHALKVGNSTAHTGCRIADCEVSGPFYGNYVTATVASGEAIVRNNKVLFDTVASQIGANDKFQGLTFADANHVSIVGNYQYGGTSGIFSDWGACTNLVVVGNHLRLMKYPISMVIGNNTQHWRDIFFIRNLFEADCDNSWSSYISTQNGASITNIAIAENVNLPYIQSTNSTFALNIAGAGGTQGSMAGIRIFRNLWPTNTSHALAFYEPVTISDNLDVEGNPYHMTPDTLGNYNEVNAIAAMPTVTYTLGGTWPPNDQLERVNQSVVIVKGNSGSGTLKLPLISLGANSWHWSGRQITVVNWSVSGTVTISVADPSIERIRQNNGITVSSMTLNVTNAPARFVSGEDGTWNQL